jgi:hypothetical protein
MVLQWVKTLAFTLNVVNYSKMFNSFIHVLFRIRDRIEQHVSEGFNAKLAMQLVVIDLRKHFL